MPQAGIDDAPSALVFNGFSDTWGDAQAGIDGAPLAL